MRSVHEVRRHTLSATASSYASPQSRVSKFRQEPADSKRTRGGGVSGGWTIAAFAVLEAVLLCSLFQLPPCFERVDLRPRLNSDATRLYESRFCAGKWCVCDQGGENLRMPGAGSTLERPMEGLRPLPTSQWPRCMSIPASCIKCRLQRVLVASRRRPNTVSTLRR